MPVAAEAAAVEQHGLPTVVVAAAAAVVDGAVVKPPDPEAHSGKIQQLLLPAAELPSDVDQSVYVVVVVVAVAEEAVGGTGILADSGSPIGVRR